MDSLKEIYDAMSQRIKSPIWGYIILAFIIINWKALYYLFFSGKPALMKFNFFDANTDGYTLYLYPVVVGLIAALAAPHVSNLGAWWATKPINTKRLREVNAAHEISKSKTKLAAELDKEERINKQKVASDERELIEQAKRDVEVKELPDDVRKNLEGKIDKLRDELVKDKRPDEFSISTKPSKLSKLAREILDRAQESLGGFRYNRGGFKSDVLIFDGGGMIEGKMGAINGFDSALLDLLRLGYIEKIKETNNVHKRSDYYELTVAGRSA